MDSQRWKRKFKQETKKKKQESDKKQDIQDDKRKRLQEAIDFPDQKKDDKNKNKKVEKKPQIDANSSNKKRLFSLLDDESQQKKEMKEEKENMSYKKLMVGRAREKDTLFGEEGDENYEDEVENSKSKTEEKPKSGSMEEEKDIQMKILESLGMSDPQPQKEEPKSAKLTKKVQKNPKDNKNIEKTIEFEDEDGEDKEIMNLIPEEDEEKPQIFQKPKPRLEKPENEFKKPEETKQDKKKRKIEKKLSIKRKKEMDKLRFVYMDMVYKKPASQEEREAKKKVSVNDALDAKDKASKSKLDKKRKRKDFLRGKVFAEFAAFTERFTIIRVVVCDYQGKLLVDEMVLPSNLEDLMKSQFLTEDRKSVTMDDKNEENYVDFEKAVLANGISVDMIQNNGKAWADVVPILQKHLYGKTIVCWRHAEKFGELAKISALKKMNKAEKIASLDISFLDPIERYICFATPKVIIQKNSIEEWAVPIIEYHKQIEDDELDFDEDDAIDSKKKNMQSLIDGAGVNAVSKVNLVKQVFLRFEQEYRYLFGKEFGLHNPKKQKIQKKSEQPEETNEANETNENTKKSELLEALESQHYMFSLVELELKRKEHDKSLLRTFLAKKDKDGEDSDEDEEEMEEKISRGISLVKTLEIFDKKKGKLEQIQKKNAEIDDLMAAIKSKMV